MGDTLGVFKESRHVSVTDEAERGCLLLEAAVGIGEIVDIAKEIRPMRCGMGDGESTDTPDIRESTQPGSLRIGEDLPCPCEGGLCILMKGIQTSVTCDLMIVISADGGAIEILNDASAFHGLGAITDDVTQADKLVHILRTGVVDDRFQSLEVCVDV